MANNITEADEAYVIGKRGQYTPVAAYLAGDEIIKIAVEHGVQMIHPGKWSTHRGLDWRGSQATSGSRAYTSRHRLWFLVRKLRIRQKRREGWPHRKRFSTYLIVGQC